jgi:glycosyltransferase involved in cell wall biosynthesis
MPKASVIITTYNRSKFLPRAVESARNAGSDVEVIVVNNGSTDDTDEVCRAIKGIKYVKLEKNANPGGGRNAGILASSADYVVLHDDDDVRLPGWLDAQIEILESDSEIGFVYGQAIRGDEDCNPSENIDPQYCPSGDLFWEILKLSIFIPCISVVVRKQCFATSGLFDSNLTSGDDWDMWIRLSEKYKVGVLQSPVAIYREPAVNANNVSSNLSQAYKTGIIIQRRGLSLPRAKEASQKQRDLTRSHLLNVASDLLIFTASDALRFGMNNTARRNLLFALKVNPFRATRPWTFKLLFQSLFSQQSITAK